MWIESFQLDSGFITFRFRNQSGNFSSRIRVFCVNTKVKTILKRSGFVTDSRSVCSSVNVVG